MNDILFTKISGKQGDIGKITLNRPQALNAMTTKMCQLTYEQLQQWAADKTIKAVIITGEGERAFCAGGDIRYFYEVGKKNHTLSRAFFWHEYRMNHAIFHFPKPYIALMHNITMGGGAGVSIHGSHRVAGENFRFAMPETAIGLHPDIGAAYFLTRCLDRIGFYLGLNGTTIGPDDACYAGIIDAIVPHESFAALSHQIAETPFGDDPPATVAKIIAKYSKAPKQPPLLEHRNIIDRCFSHRTSEEIIAALRREQSPWALQTAEELLKRSPISLKITLKKLLDSLQLSLDDCLRMDFRLTLHILEQHDFYEGIRAAIIDKDRNPKWQPANLTEISENEVAKYFAPVKGGDLAF